MHYPSLLDSLHMLLFLLVGWLVVWWWWWLIRMREGAPVESVLYCWEGWYCGGGGCCCCCCCCLFIFNFVQRQMKWFVSVANSQRKTHTFMNQCAELVSYTDLFAPLGVLLFFIFIFVFVFQIKIWRKKKQKTLLFYV